MSRRYAAGVAFSLLVFAPSFSSRDDCISPSPPSRRVAKTPPGYENAFGTMHRFRRGLSSSFLSAHQAVRIKGGRGRYLRDGSGRSRSKGGGSIPTGTGRHREGNNEACNERTQEHRRLRNGHITVTIFLCKCIRHEGFPPFLLLLLLLHHLLLRLPKHGQHCEEPIQYHEQTYSSYQPSVPAPLPPPPPPFPSPPSSQQGQ